MSVDKWIEFWKSHDSSGYHNEDRQVIESRPEVDIRGLTASNFTLEPEDYGKLHPELRPVPYVGNLKKATLILTMLNPTVDRQDYEDNERRAFQELLTANRMQTVQDCFAIGVTDGDKLLAPSWCDYFGRMFNAAIDQTHHSSGREKNELWLALRNCLAIVELVPYYSRNASRLQTDWYTELESVKLAREAMQEIQKRRGVKIICRWPRDPERWGLEKGSYVPSTRAGLSAEAKQAVCEHLKSYVT